MKHNVSLNIPSVRPTARSLAGFMAFAFAATHASATLILVDDFNDGNDDGWSRVDSNEGHPWGPGIHDASSGVYQLMTTGVVPSDAPGRGFLLSLWDPSSDPIFSNGFVRAKVRIDTPQAVGVILFRYSGDLDNGFDGYAFGGIAGEGFFFNRIESSDTDRLLEMPGEVMDVGEQWWMEGGAVGDQLSLKVWRNGEREPESPQLTFVDSTHTNGLLGVDANMAFSSSVEGIVNTTFDDIYFRLPESESKLCDFDGDQLCGGTDIDQLMTDAATGGIDTDLTGDGTVNNADRDIWLALAGEENEFAGPLLTGDSDLNGTVDATDLNALALHWQATDNHNWTSGNFSTAGNPGVNAADLNVLALNWRGSSAAARPAVPAPTGMSLALTATAIALSTYRNRRFR